MQLTNTVNLLFLLLVAVQSEVRWTQYSDRASMPKSKRERDRLRDLLSRVNEEHLTSTEDKQRYADLKSIFQEDDVIDQQTNGIWLDRNTIVVGLVGILAAIVLFKRWSSTPPSQTLDDAAREARLKKFLRLNCLLE